MEFGIKKCVMLIIKSGKNKLQIERSNQEIIRTQKEKENYMYLGILDADTIK